MAVTMSSESADTLVLNQFIPYRVVSLGKQISDSLAKIYSEEFDLSVAEWRILASLAELPAQTARDIGTLTGMDKVKMSRAVKLLDEKDCLLKQKNAKDKRASYLTLSARGIDLYKEIAPQALAWEQELISVLQPDEHKVFMAVMDKLQARLA